MPIQFGSTTVESVTLPQLRWLLENFPWTRQVSAVHLHHSRRPNHDQYRGRATLRTLADQHRNAYGLGAIAQHLTVSPDGTIWLGRNWNLPPASAAGHNGSNVSGPLMITMIGDFDRGQDKLAYDDDLALDGGNDRAETHQGNTTLRLLGLLQHHLDLDVETLRFHNELSHVTSPGSSIDKRSFLRELRKVRTLLRKADKASAIYPLPARAQAELRPLLSAFTTSTLTRAENAAAELDEQGIGSRDFARFVDSTYETTSITDRALFGPTITPSMLDELAPYVINLTQGFLSDDGVMQTDEADVKAIFGDHLERAFADRERDKPLRIVFYAHGGLVGEKRALMQAYQHAPWWRKNNVYPIYFVWETGLLPTFFQSLRGTRDRALSREAFTDRIVDELARGAGGPRVWQAIKSSARTASLDQLGGARIVIDALGDFLQNRKDDVELHAVGHSAGAIFHSYFVPTTIEQLNAKFNTVQFLAPAITIQDFKDRMVKHMGKEITHLPMYTMRKELERKDPVASPWYNRSILYMVRNAMERKRNTPILGLEESLRADADMRAKFGLRGRAAKHGEVVWTTTDHSTGRSASNADSHVDFNCDPPTMNSVLRRVINADDNDPIAEYPKQFACSSDRSIAHAVELPPELEQLAAEGLFDPTTYVQPQTITIGGGAIGGQREEAGAAPRPGGGRRRALCIGIDEYETSPLGGCVADARLWAETLQGLGFEAPTMLLNQAATRSAIVDAFTNMVTSSRTGDVVVIQFAGHGIFLPDLDGDEANEDSPEDEALCPVDFGNGAYLIDDDIRKIFAQTPDGVNLTCFFDCCHSGSITRFAVGATGADTARGERARYLRATPERIEAHRRYRQDMGFTRAVGSRGPADMRDVVFSACLSTEVALESNGHGHFTRRATEQLRNGINGVTNEQFHRNVVDAFGAARRQTPFLDCAPDARSRFLLQPITQPAISGVGTVPGSGATGMSGSSTDRASLIALLHKLLAELQQ